MTALAAKSAAAFVLLTLALVPHAHGQAAAGAVAGDTGAFAGAGFPAGFPFNFPFARPFPVAPLCTPGWTVNPWKPPAQIGTPGPNLVSTLNGKTVFSDVTLCCGSSITFGWPIGETHGIQQLASGACPASFTNNPAAGQRQLFAPSATATNQVLTLDTPGNYWFTSQQGNDCAQGQVIKVTVPAGTCSGSGTSATSTTPGGEQRTSTGPGSQASASGPPGGTSTSSNNGSAAAASGPPGEQTTFTGPGQSFSSSGGRR